MSKIWSKSAKYVDVLHLAELRHLNKPKIRHNLYNLILRMGQHSIHQFRVFLRAYFSKVSITKRAFLVIWLLKGQDFFESKQLSQPSKWGCATQNSKNHPHFAPPPHGGYRDKIGLVVTESNQKQEQVRQRNKEITASSAACLSKQMFGTRTHVD